MADNQIPESLKERLRQFGYEEWHIARMTRDEAERILASREAGTRNPYTTPSQEKPGPLIGSLTEVGLERIGNDIIAGRLDVDKAVSRFGLLAQDIAYLRKYLGSKGVESTISTAPSASSIADLPEEQQEAIYRQQYGAQRGVFGEPARGTPAHAGEKVQPAQPARSTRRVEPVDVPDWFKSPEEEAAAAGVQAGRTDWGWLTQHEGVSIENMGGGGRWVQARLDVEKENVGKAAFYKRIESVPGGYRVDGRLIQWQQTGPYTREKLTSPQEFIGEAFKKARTQILARGMAWYSDQGDVQRTGQAAFTEQLSNVGFPGMPRGWSTVLQGVEREEPQESHKEHRGKLWHRWSPQFQARMFSGMQIRTREGEYRDPGAWRSLLFPESMGLYVSRGSERRAEAQREGRFLTFPTEAFRASTEMFAGSGRFLAGFKAGKAPKRLQMGAQELFPVEKLPITESPFQTPPVRLPEGRGEFQPPRERGQAIRAAVLFGGLMPEGMGQVDLPPTYEEKWQSTPIPLGPGGQLRKPTGVEEGTYAGRYEKLVLGHTPEGAPITYDVGDWERGEIVRQHIVKEEGRHVLKSLIRRTVPTGSNTAYKAQAQKIYSVAGLLPGQLGVQAVLPYWKNEVGAAHSVLAAASELDPKGFQKLKKEFGLTDEWSAAKAKDIMTAAQSYILEHTEMVDVAVTMHESLFPGFRPGLEEGQAVAKEGFFGKLRGAEAIGEGRHRLTLGLPMYRGPVLYQQRREYFNRQPFLSREELRQIEEFVSPEFRKQLETMSRSGRGDPYVELQKIWEARGKAKRVQERFTAWEGTPEAFEAALAAKKDLEAEIGDPTQRWLEALEQTMGGEELPIRFRAAIDKPRIFGGGKGPERDFLLPSPKTIRRFGAVSELGEEVAPITTSYARLTEMLAGGMKGPKLTEGIAKFDLAYRKLIESPEFQRKLQGAFPRHAVEGPMSADIALAPREAIFGREALAQLAGIPLGEKGSEAKLESFIREVEQRYEAGDPLTSLILRRPVSDPKGQFESVAVKILTERLAHRPEIGATVKDLGRSVSFSPWIAAAGRGDVDVDRFIALLAHEGNLRHVPDIVSAQLPRGESPVRETRLWTPFGGRLHQFERPASVDEGGWDIKTPQWAREMLARDLPKQYMARIEELAGPAQGETIWRGDVHWSEMGKWAEAIGGDKPLDRLAMLLREGAWGRFRAKDDPTYGALHEITTGELQDAYVDEMLNKAMGMTMPYNIGRQLEMIGADREARMAFTSTFYQYGLDRMFRMLQNEGAAPEALKTILEIAQTWVPEDPTKGIEGGYYQKMHEYRQKGFRDPTTGRVELGAQWKRTGYGTAGAVEPILGAIGEMVQRTPEDVGRKLSAEQAARLIYGPGATKEHIEAVRSGSVVKMQQAAGSYAKILEAPGIVQAIIAPRLASREAKRSWYGDPSMWRGVDVNRLVERGRRMGQTVGMLSRSRGIRDIVRGMWEAPPGYDYGGVLGAMGVEELPPERQLDILLERETPGFNLGTRGEVGDMWYPGMPREQWKELIETKHAGGGEIIARVGTRQTILKEGAMQKFVNVLKAEGERLSPEGYERIRSIMAEHGVDITKQIGGQRLPTEAQRQIGGATYQPGTGGGYLWETQQVAATQASQTQAVPQAADVSAGADLHIKALNALADEFRGIRRQMEEGKGKSFPWPGYMEDRGEGLGRRGQEEIRLGAIQDAIKAFTGTGATAEEIAKSGEFLAYERGIRGPLLQLSAAVREKPAAERTPSQQKAVIRSFGDLQRETAALGIKLPQELEQFYQGYAEAYAASPTGQPESLAQRAWLGAYQHQWRGRRSFGAAQEFGAAEGAAMMGHLGTIAEARQAMRVEEPGGAVRYDVGRLGTEEAYRAAYAGMQLGKTGIGQLPSHQQFMEEVQTRYPEAMKEVRATEQQQIFRQQKVDEVQANFEQLSQNILTTSREFEAVGDMAKMISRPENRDMWQQFGKQVALLNEDVQRFRQQGPWARDAMWNVGRQAFQQLQGLEAGEWTPTERRRFQSLQQLSELGRYPGAEYGPLGQDIEALALEQQREEITQALQAEPPTTGRRVRTMAEQLLGEFSIGGTFFRMMAMRRVLGQPVQQWMGAGAQYAQSQLGFGVAMGAEPAAIMATPMGQLQGYQAQMGGFQAGMGEMALMQRAGLAQMVGGLIGGGNTLAAGRRVGMFATPAMTGAMYGLGAGMVTAAGAQAAGTAGLAGLSAGLGAAVAPITLGIGGLVAGGLYAGQAYQMAEPAQWYRQNVEMEMGYRQRHGVTASLGYAMHSFMDVNRELLAGDNPIDVMARIGRGENIRNAFPGMGEQLGDMGRMLLQGDFEGALDRFLQPEEGTWESRLEEGYEEFRGTRQYQIARASLYVENLDIEGLDAEGKQAVASLLALGGVSPEDIAAGRADELMRQFAPLQMLGMTGEVATRATQMAGAVGVAPGVGFQPYMEYMAELSPTEQMQAVSASQVLGTIAQQVGEIPAIQQIEQYAEALQAGETIPELELRARREYGALPIAQAMGYAAGTPMARAVSARAAPDQVIREGAPAQYGMIEVPSGEAYFGMTQEGAAPVIGGIEGGMARQQAMAQIASQFAPYADIAGMTWEEKIDYYTQLERERAGEMRAVETPAGQYYEQFVSGIGGTQQQRQQQARYGVTGLEQYYGVPTGQAILPWMQDYTGQQWAQAGVVAPFAGQLYQQAGVSPFAGQRTYEALLRAGVGPARLQQLTQGTLGMGGIAQAAGMPGGFAFEPQALGMLMPQQYQQMASMAQFGMGQLGASMMAGGWGAATPLRTLFAGLQAQGVGPGIYTGTPLYEQAGGGVYGVNQLALRRLGREQAAYQQQYRMEGLQMQQYYRSQAPVMVGQGEGAYTVYGMRGIEDAMTARSREYQRSQWAYQGRSQEMQYRHALERLAMSQAMWQTQVGFRRQEMGIQWGQMQQQQQWQLQDFSFGRQMAGFQYGYQQDELNRAIRLATGRERQQLLRRREYGEELFAMQEGQRGREEERARTMMDWDEERFNRQKQQFEEITALQAEQFAMQRRHIEENYALQQEMQGAAKKYQEEMWALEDARRQLTRENEDEQLERQIEYAETMYAFYERERTLREGIEDAHAEYLQWQIDAYSPGGSVYNAFKKLIEMVKNEVETPPPPDDPKDDTEGPFEGDSSGAGATTGTATTSQVPVKLVVGDREMSAYLEMAVNEVARNQRDRSTWGGRGS